MVKTEIKVPLIVIMTKYYVLNALSDTEHIFCDWLHSHSIHKRQERDRPYTQITGREMKTQKVN